MSQLQLIRELERKQDRLMIEIEWANFALKAPAQFTTPKLQEARFLKIIELLRRLIEVTAQLEEERWEYKVIQEHKAVQAALKEFGVPYRSENGVFYLLP